VPQVAAEIQEVMDEEMEDWKDGRLEEMQRKNLNRGYRKLTVWKRCDQILRSDL
jgi:hypothetical protein